MSRLSQSLLNAQKFTHKVIESGSTIKLIRPGTKDAGGMITTPVELIVKSFPIEFAPFERKVSDIVGWDEEIDVIFTIEANGRTVNEIKQYQDIEFDNTLYKIKFVANDSQFASIFLHIIIGGKK